MFFIKRESTALGYVLKDEFLKLLGIIQKQLADYIGCDVKVVNRLVSRRTSITAEIAVKHASVLDTTVEFWLNAQQAVDIYK